MSNKNFTESGHEYIKGYNEDKKLEEIKICGSDNWSDEVHSGNNFKERKEALIAGRRTTKRMFSL